MKKNNLNFHNNENVLINHDGVVSKISENKVTVSLYGNINCETCNAKSACGVTENTSKEIDILNNDLALSINDTVTVQLKRGLGLKAVFWAYFLPFFLLVVVLFITSRFLVEWLSGIIALFILVPYYITLFVLKDKFKKVFTFSILKKQ